MQNYMYIITTIITYDFPCIGIETMIALLERGHVIIKYCFP